MNARWSSIYFSMLLSVLLSGCGKGVDPALSDVDQHIPAALSRLQGKWEQADTVGSGSCILNIVGYTMRFQFRETESAPVLKRNIPIAGIDVQRSLIMVNNGTAAWPYELQGAEGSVILQLQFYDPQASCWRKVSLTRLPAP